MMLQLRISDLPRFFSDPGSQNGKFIFFSFVTDFFFKKNFRYSVPFHLQAVITRISTQSKANSTNFVLVHIRDDTGCGKAVLMNERCGDVGNVQVGQTVDFFGASARLTKSPSVFPVEIILDRKNQSMRKSASRLSINVKQPFGKVGQTKMSEISKVTAGKLINICARVMKTASDAENRLLLTLADNSSLSTVKIDSTSLGDSFASGQVFFFFL
jgi:hypothetical protein